MFTSAIKREIRKVHVVIVQWRQSNVQKSVIHLQSCSFVNLILLLFLPFSLPSPSSLLKLPVHEQNKGVTYKCELESDTRARYEIRGWSTRRGKKRNVLY